MRYYGGKSKIAKDIAEVMSKETFYVYWEPFCGACNVVSRIHAPVRIATDIQPDLIMMWDALQLGWIPPDGVTEEEYRDLKEASDPGPLRAFAGFGCSFGGKWFAGYARNKEKWNYAAMTKRSVGKKIAKMGDVYFLCTDYQNADVAELLKLGPLLIYCDPPYRTTTADYASGKFDTEAFWEWVRGLSPDAKVFVSEYEAPSDFQSVWKKHMKTQMHGDTGMNLCRVEQLFTLRRDV
jgi:DNA adenine methylase